MSHQTKRSAGDHLTFIRGDDDCGLVVAGRYAGAASLEVEVLTRAEWDGLPDWEGPHPADFESGAAFE